ncbi:MAG: trimeric intracellular cation channel family protein, partial [Ilumatobacteraceae bacterium]
MQFSQEAVLDVLDLCGVAVFAASGAVLAIRRRFDIVGLLTLAFVAGLGGGVLRDLILARGVPVAFDNPKYAIVAFVTAII